MYCILMYVLQSCRWVNTVTNKYILEMSIVDDCIMLQINILEISFVDDCILFQINIY